jgi:hypothetical protein
MKGLLLHFPIMISSGYAIFWLLHFTVIAFSCLSVSKLLHFQVIAFSGLSLLQIIASSGWSIIRLEHFQAIVRFTVLDRFPLLHSQRPLVKGCQMSESVTVSTFFSLVHSCTPVAPTE